MSNRGIGHFDNLDKFLENELIGQLGIVRLDYGFYNSNNNSWSEDGRYYLDNSNTELCHEKLNKFFLIKLKELPVASLVKYFNQANEDLHNNIEKKILEIFPNYLKTENRGESLLTCTFCYDHSLCEFVDINQDQKGRSNIYNSIVYREHPIDLETLDLHEEESTYFENLDIPFDKIRDYDQGYLNKFKLYQKEFTKALFSYYTHLNEKIQLRYATIVLAAVKKAKGIYISHFIAAFSDNIMFIKDLRFRLLVQTIGEIRHRKFVEELQRQNKQEAIKSAKAAIMSRNMSHNLGSHVIYYLRQYLNGDTKELAELLQNLNIEEKGEDIKVSFGEDPLTGISKSIVNKSKFELPFLRGIGTFLTYLQERQDFIASIATDSIPSFTTVNFKDFIVDNLLRDKKASRHRDNTRQERNILLNYIAKSENTDIVITFNGTSLDESISVQGRNDLYKIMVDIPGGILGRQAFYSIVENIIRNSAKHSTVNQEKKELKLDISIEKSGYNTEYYGVTICDNQKISKTTKKKLQCYLLNDQLIDNETYKLNDDHKGIKEILISALWLTGKNIMDVKDENRSKYIDIINLEKDDNLAYRFWLLRTKKLLIIVDTELAETQADDIEFKVISISTFFLEEQDNFKRFSRYGIVIDATKDGINHHKSGLATTIIFRRYFKVHRSELFHDPSNSIKLDEDSYIRYYLMYLQKQYGNTHFQGIFESVKFEFNINTNDTGSKTRPAHFELPEIRRWFNLEKNAHEISIEKGIGESVVYKEVGAKQIAFLRHLENNPNELFIDGFDINSDRSRTIEKLKKIKQEFISIESITGNNASFSMISDAIFNDEWALKQLEAAFAKVLIIDERLYDTYNPKTHNFNTSEHSTHIKQQIFDLLNEVFVFPKESNCENLNTANSDQLLSIFAYAAHSGKHPRVIEILRESNIRLEKVELKLDKFHEHYISYIIKLRAILNTEQKSYMDFKRAFIFSLKNIDVATLKEKKLENIWGEELGLIDENGSIHINQAYHYISIHQGIIDKLFNIVQNDSNDKAKYFESILAEFNNKALIKSIVHTGRGKPNYIEGVSAYQSLSDLDQALRESKINIIDYFISASYESKP